MLADAGYDCGLAGKLHLSTSKFGEMRYDDGYRVFHYSNLPYPDQSDDTNQYLRWLRDEKQVDPATLFRGRGGFCAPGLPSELHQVTWCSEMAIQFIREPRTGPWLLSINPFDPHPPFDPPPEFFDRYDPARIPLPLFRESDLERQTAFLGIRQQKIDAVDPRGEMPLPAELPADITAAQTYQAPTKFNGRAIKAAYYAMIEHLDYQLGRIIDVLEQTGQLANTIIIFHSDHGELLGDHGLIFKGCRFFEGAVHVPLIVAGNRSDFRPAWKARHWLSWSMLLRPFWSRPGSRVPSRMQGKSLWSILTGACHPDDHKSHVVCDFNDSVGYSPVETPTQATMTFDGRHKMVIYHREGDLGELFDLQNGSR